VSVVGPVVAYPDGTSPRARRSGSSWAEADRGAGYGPDVEHGDEDVVGDSVLAGAAVVVGLVVGRFVVGVCAADWAAVLCPTVGVALPQPENATPINVVAHITASQRRRMRRS
jgi:hypothetical protein